VAHVRMSLALGLTGLLLVAGCSLAGSTALGEADDGTAVTVGVGDTVTVRLPSNVTTGFKWVVVDPGPLARSGEAVYEAPDAPGAVGAGGNETFTFRAGSAGTGDLTLEYRRPWERDVPAEKTWAVEMTVR
jgi:inhibitor of cysteine peptidase